MAEGYSITTYKRQLRCSHRDWMEKTQAVFDEVLAFYYKILAEDPSYLELSNQNALRQLEIKTIPKNKEREAEIPIPVNKVPLYFRRAIINTALSMRRSYAGAVATWEKNDRKTPRPSPPSRIHASMVYYKGMYKDFEAKAISLKLFNGEKWVWVRCGHFGRPLPETAEIMSPTIVLEKKKIAMNLPVKQTVTDTRTAKNRVQAGESFVAVALRSGETLAVCTLFGADGIPRAPYFIKGGKALAHRKNQILGHIKKHPGSEGAEGRPNKKYYEKITRITDHYAHEVSRKIVDYARAQGAKIIVVPEYGTTFAQGTLPYMSSTIYDFIGRRIIHFVEYKAWQAGIVIQRSYITQANKKCFHCDEAIERFDTVKQRPRKNSISGKSFKCPQGHGGSAALNAARNLGQSFHRAFYPPKDTKEE